METDRTAGGGGRDVDDVGWETIVAASERLRVRADIIGHARINMSVNLSHACFEMAD